MASTRAGRRSGCSIGLLLANGVLSLIGAITSEDAFLSWGWRVPFLLSGVLVLVGLWIRMTISESPHVPRGRGHRHEGPGADRRRPEALPESGCSWRWGRASGSTWRSTPSSCSLPPTSSPTSGYPAVAMP
ncbi:MAG: hypothetical protein WKF47_04405 [Geodermatophilaceae bacterium]